jgi:hypothetical protein
MPKTGAAGQIADVLHLEDPLQQADVALGAPPVAAA